MLPKIEATIDFIRKRKKRNYHSLESKSCFRERGMKIMRNCEKRKVSYDLGLGAGVEWLKYHKKVLKLLGFVILIKNRGKI